MIRQLENNRFRNDDERLYECIAACLDSTKANAEQIRTRVLAKFPEYADVVDEFLVSQLRLEALMAPLRIGQPSLADTATIASAESTDFSQTWPVLCDYEILKVIAKGGMGIVYRASQISLGRIVALKMIRSTDPPSEADVQKFREEAQRVAQLDHASIVPVYESGSKDGRPYFTMRLMENGSLADRLARGPVPPREAAEIIVKLARAVHFAHQRGILHRDIKPGNILFDGEGQPSIGDFGLAQHIERNPATAHSTVIVGTAMYMAPEQAKRSGALTTAVDVYSLGAVLYELLTGRPPFRADTPLNTLIELTHREPKRPRLLNVRIDLDLETICLKCLQKEPDRRYGAAETLADDLDRWLAGLPIIARRTSALTRFGKWMKRRPEMAGVLVAGIVAVLATVGLAVGMVYNSELKTALENARIARTSEESERRRTEVALKQSEDYLYLYRIALANNERAATNVTRASEVLKECPEKRRGWEWHYLWRQCQSDNSRSSKPTDSVTMEGKHPRAVYAVAFSHDNRWLASASADRTVKVWDIQTGRESLTFDRHSSYVETVAFHPDGERIASAGADKVIRIWDRTTGKELQTLAGHTGGINAIVFLPGSGRLVSASNDQTVRIWNIDQPEPLTLKGHDVPVNCVAVGFDGHLIATGGSDGQIILWNSVTGQKRRSIRAGGAAEERDQKPILKAIAFQPDSQRLASSDSKGAIRIWDVASGELLFELSETGTAVEGLLWSPKDSDRLMTASQSGAVRAWDLGSHKRVLSFKCYAHSLAFNPDGTMLAYAGANGSVGFFDARPVENRLP